MAAVDAPAPSAGVIGTTSASASAAAPPAAASSSTPSEAAAAAPSAAAASPSTPGGWHRVRAGPRVSLRCNQKDARQRLAPAAVAPPVGIGEVTRSSQSRRSCAAVRGTVSKRTRLRGKRLCCCICTHLTCRRHHLADVDGRKM
eukprot:1668584-Prymnesium_polylepis.1